MNPWETVRLDVYEKHMRLESVRQLQALNEMMKIQFSAYPETTCQELFRILMKSLRRADGSFRQFGHDPIPQQAFIHRLKRFRVFIPEENTDLVQLSVNHQAADRRIKSSFQ